MNIRNFALLIPFIFIVSCLKDNSKINSLNNGQIIKVLQDQTTCWNNGDINGFMEGYAKSDSLQFITKKGRTVGWQKVLENYKKHYPTKKQMGELHFKNLILNPLADNITQVFGNWEVKSDTVYTGNFSLIMKKDSENWKIIIDHTW